MLKGGLYTIAENTNIARDVFRLRLIGDTSAIKRPGQFVNIRLDGFYLRRPISVCSWRPGEMTLIYKILGKGTATMAGMRPGRTLNLLTGLGNGFDLEPARGKRVALVGGGVGVPPLYGVMEALKGEDVTCVLGFRSAADGFYAAEFTALGAKVFMTTEDGSVMPGHFQTPQGPGGAAPGDAGRRDGTGTLPPVPTIPGFVTDALRNIRYDYYFACGPGPMLRAVHALGKEGQLSFEERMGCGFGACMGCTCRTLTGPKRICVDGPLFRSEEVSFDA